MGYSFICLRSPDPTLATKLGGTWKRTGFSQVKVDIKLWEKAEDAISQ
jgi:hypothetical protein